MAHKSNDLLFSYQLFFYYPSVYALPLFYVHNIEHTTYMDGEKAIGNNHPDMQEY